MKAEATNCPLQEREQGCRGEGTEGPGGLRGAQGGLALGGASFSAVFSTAALAESPRSGPVGQKPGHQVRGRLPTLPAHLYLLPARPKAGGSAWVVGARVPQTSCGGGGR